MFNDVICLSFQRSFTVNDTLAAKIERAARDGIRGAYVIHANEANRAVDSPKKRNSQGGGGIVLGVEERRNPQAHPSEGGLERERERESLHFMCMNETSETNAKRTMTTTTSRSSRNEASKGESSGAWPRERERA